MYSFITEEKDKIVNKKKAKGVKKNVIKKEITHDNYLIVPFNNQKMHHQMRSIRSELHQISSYHLNKVSLFTVLLMIRGIF